MYARMSVRTGMYAFQDTVTSFQVRYVEVRTYLR